MPKPGAVWQGKVWQPGPGFLGGKWVALAQPKPVGFAAAFKQPAPAAPASSSPAPFVWQGKALQKGPGLGATFVALPPQPLPLSHGFLGGSTLKPSSSSMADKQVQVAAKKGLADYLDDIGSFASKVAGTLGKLQSAFGGGVAPPSSPAPAGPAPGPSVEPPSVGAPPTPSVAPFLLLGGGALALVLFLR